MAWLTGSWLDRQVDKRISNIGIYIKCLQIILTSLVKNLGKNVRMESEMSQTTKLKSHLEIQIDQLKEELTEKITQLQSHKESNFKLTQVRFCPDSQGALTPYEEVLLGIRFPHIWFLKIRFKEIVFFYLRRYIFIVHFLIHFL